MDSAASGGSKILERLERCLVFGVFKTGFCRWLFNGFRSLFNGFRYDLLWFPLRFLWFPSLDCWWILPPQGDPKF